ncbi:hypothetical protein [Vibrio cholerae]|uniref:hypothetical protein n=1 Tax=Vibrio cholerae TaxID=666 RepID=UPI000E682CA1|nr:hypothetical protein [Vibrio cholerae]
MIVKWLTVTAEKFGLTEKQVELIWYRGQVGVGDGNDSPGDKNSPEYFTKEGLTEEGIMIFKEAEEARKKYITDRLTSLID